MSILPKGWSLSKLDAMEQDPQVELYDHWADSYDRRIASGSAPLSFEGYELVLDQVVTLAEVAEGMDILDVGTGTGNLAARFLACDCEVWGIDASVQMLARARAKLPTLRICEANIKSEVWPNCTGHRFDRVVSTYVLHTFDQAFKIQLLSRISQEFLTDNGLIIIADIAYPDRKARAQAQAQWGRLWSDDDFYWAADETIEACREAQLTCSYRQASSCAGIFVIGKM